MKSKIMFILSLLFGFMFISAGLDKFLHFMPIPDDMSEALKTSFNAFMAITWLMPLVGVIEILGGILFVIPRTRALGALIIFPVMVGILLVNTVTDTTGLPIAGVLMFINLLAIYEDKEKFLDLI